MTEKESLKIRMFFCSNCLDREDIDSYCSQLGIDKRMAISIPCSGKINMPYLVKAFETGAEAVVILTCEIGECRRLEGNKRAKKRAQAVESLLDEIGMRTGRIAVFEISQNEQKQTMTLIRRFFESVRRIPTECGVKAVT